MSKNGGVSGSASDLLDAFAETVLRWPERTAIESPERTLSYQQLELCVSRLAADLGDRPGPVAAVATHSPDTVIALLGILAAGGAYVPLDPAFPLERQRRMAATAGCRTLVGRDAGDHAERLGLRHQEPPEPPAVPARPADLREQPAGPPRGPAVAPGDPAYVLFTSGSTGQPKPVLTPRRAITASVASLRGLFGVTPEDRVLQFASLNWDTCFEEILPTLTAGARLVFDPEAHSASVPRLLRMVERRGVTVLDLPTAFWHELVLHLAEDGGRPQLPDCLRLVVIGGEAAGPARLADWSGLVDSARIRLLNTYGCTETTLITHAVDLLGPDTPEPGRRWDPAERAPIGRALPHVEELLSGEGELLIGGAALATGYPGLPEATAERFVTREGRRWFRTGDRATRAADGVLTHQGRLDHEVKIRGIRVDPAEVEAALGAHPRVGAAAVAATTLAGRAALVAYVVPRTGGPDQALGAEVLRRLRELLPAHLVPSRITVVPDLVRTTSGKVDRAASHRLHGTGPIT
ncbi:amino acid adenylation domain-containing protein [Streptomyces sp. TLI_171]|uniref:amino acid adenylation domain-containing protein n=1 Tax=Streptomyces sp. TLI_171 TaxID=1938859 RepID=UPI000C18A7DB|nr:amino acid adenylation domain-containing protein [Streptomyces sp. TLI_171]RKE22244.1 nonribosomal peptide synthetase protein VioO [Streptomyces sp. TLI_171]